MHKRFVLIGYFDEDFFLLCSNSGIIVLVKLSVWNSKWRDPRSRPTSFGKIFEGINVTILAYLGNKI